MLNLAITAIILLKVIYVESVNECDCTWSVVSASARYSTDTNWNGFVSSGTDPLDPLNGISIHYKGVNQGGSNTVYDYLIVCETPCWIKSISVQGAAWRGDQIILYNGDKSHVLGTTSVSGGNTFQSHNLDVTANEQYVTQFRLEETNTDTNWRYRSLIAITNAARIPTISPTKRPTTIPTISPSMRHSLHPFPAPSKSSTSFKISNECDCTVSVVSASERYSVGTTWSGFISSGSAPLDPWNAISIHYKGGTNIVYDYRIVCRTPCWIQNINVQGAAWKGDQITLYNGDKSQVLGSASVSGGNTFQSHNLVVTANAHYLTAFRLQETNTDTTWRWRSLIKITSTAIIPSESKPPSCLVCTCPKCTSIIPTITPSKRPSIQLAPRSTTSNSIFRTASILNSNTNVPTKAPTSFRTLHLVCIYHDDLKYATTHISLSSYGKMMVDTILYSMPFVLLHPVNYDDTMNNPYAAWNRGGVTQFNLCVVFDKVINNNDSQCTSYLDLGHNTNDNEYIAIGTFHIVADKALQRYSNRIIDLLTSNDFHNIFVENMNAKLDENVRRRLVKYDNFNVIQITVIDSLDDTTKSADVRDDNNVRVSDSNTIMMLLIVAAIIILILLIICMYYFQCKQKETAQKYSKVEVTKAPTNTFTVTNQ